MLQSFLVNSRYTFFTVPGSKVLPTMDWNCTSSSTQMRILLQPILSHVSSMSLHLHVHTHTHTEVNGFKERNEMQFLCHWTWKLVYLSLPFSHDLNTLTNKSTNPTNMLDNGTCSSCNLLQSSLSLKRWMWSSASTALTLVLTVSPQSLGPEKHPYGHTTSLTGGCGQHFIVSSRASRFIIMISTLLGRQCLYGVGYSSFYYLLLFKLNFHS